MRKAAQFLACLLVSVVMIATIVQFHHHDRHGYLHADLIELFDADPCHEHHSDTDNSNKESYPCSIRLDVSLAASTDQDTADIQPFIQMVAVIFFDFNFVDLQSVFCETPYLFKTFPHAFIKAATPRGPPFRI